MFYTSLVLHKSRKYLQRETIEWDSSYEYFIAGHWPDINNPKVSELDLKFSTSRFYSSQVCKIGGSGGGDSSRMRISHYEQKRIRSPHLCPGAFTLIVNIILSNYATSERLCLRGRGCKGSLVATLADWLPATTTFPESTLSGVCSNLQSVAVLLKQARLCSTSLRFRSPGRLARIRDSRCARLNSRVCLI